MSPPKVPSDPEPGGRGPIPPDTEESESVFDSMRDTMTTQPDRAGRGASDPTRVGRYVILQRLGEGAMGVVYAAYDTELDRKIAIKLVRSGDSGQTQGRPRVLREAQALAQISHPNVVHVYEVGEAMISADDGTQQQQVFIAMEFVPGISLYQWQAAQPREPAAVLDLYIQAGEGLHAAHRAGLIHRDFKPDNVLVGEDGRVRVVDFGLARAARSSDSEPAVLAPSAESSRALDLRLTQDGAIMGTPAYMSPEQFRGTAVDAQTDQFSFCAALYEALFRQTPFPGPSRDVISALVIAGKVRPPPPNELGLDVTQALLRGLSVDPNARFPSMRELIDELRKGMGPHVDTRGSRRARRIFAAVFAAVAGLCSIPPLVDNRPPPISVLLTVAVVCLAVACLITAISYKRLRQHPEHWSMVLLVNLALAQLALGRAAALWMGVTLFQYTPIDHVVVLGFVAVVALRWIPKMGFVLLPVLLSGVLCALAPARFWQLPAVLYPLIGCLYALWWPQRIRTPSQGSTV